MAVSEPKAFRAEELLESLKYCHKPIDIPGNFRARQRKVRHDSSSKVFPKRGRKCEHQTTYAVQFCSKEAKPSTPRPCSATRRNNPHPSQKFLTWRIPTRMLDPTMVGNESMDRMMQSNVSDCVQRFYNDYSGMRRDVDEIETRVLLDLTKGYGVQPRRHKEKVSKPKPTFICNEAGKAEFSLKKECLPLPKILQKQRTWSPKRSSPDQETKPTDVSIENVSPLFLKPEFKPIFQTWYDSVSKEDKEKVKEVMEKADKSFLEQTLGSALKPDAVVAVENWLLNCDENEREIALQFLQALILAVTQESVPTENDVLRGNHFGQHDKRCNLCVKKRLGETLDKVPIDWCTNFMEDINKASSSFRKQMAARRLRDIRDTEPAVFTNITRAPIPTQFDVHHKKKAGSRSRHLNFVKTDVPVARNHRGALFVEPHRNVGSYFTIHPEWD